MQYQRNKFSLKIPDLTQSFKSRFQTGFTLLELLIVVAILALLIISLFLGVNLQLMRSRDAQRKAHLEKLRLVFENYYNDNQTYPPENIFFNGGTKSDPAICDQPLAALQPYLDKVPCDPDTREPYNYLSIYHGLVADGYRLYTQLEDKNDQGIKAVGCTSAGCGDLSDFNYGISVGGELSVRGDGTISDSPTIPVGMPTGFIGNYVCSPNYNILVNGGRPYCKSYSDPVGRGCGAATLSLGECSPYCYAGSPIICRN
jgi:prepilin-type N-terminal cleavage/methylation domain-containing protein